MGGIILLSSESVDESAWKKINKNTKRKSKKQSFTSKDVYPSSSSSSEESSVHSGNYKGSKSNTACKQSYPIASMYKKESESYTSKSKKKERTQQHPSIFKNDSEAMMTVRAVREVMIQKVMSTRV
jgi:hypothetical protein